MTFLVDAYTEAVEAEFAAEFSINNYTAAIEAQFLQTFFDEDKDTDDSIGDDEAGGGKQDHQMLMSIGLAMSIKPIGIQDSLMNPSEKKPTICLNETDTGNSDPYFECRCRRSMISFHYSLRRNGYIRQSIVSVRKR